MNIEEAKKAIRELDAFNYCDFKGNLVRKIDVLSILDQIDKPQPEVPQMIFDVIKSFDDDVDYLHHHMSRQSDEVREWLTHNEREFYEAWLAYPNITVEKEKLYTVKVLGSTLFKMTSDNGTEYKLIGKNETPSESKFNGYKFEVNLTEKEIKEADERLWQFAKEVTDL
ncbi:TPA: DUF1642 domain-containing protein [Streptococcus agalactiae]|nr:DUF1642 domain-containing protein [Streptococcus agalactiae]HEM9643379.1 DUF1642 domain-containing protein [Streptococcus agalactiae]